MTDRLHRGDWVAKVRIPVRVVFTWVGGGLSVRGLTRIVVMSVFDGFTGSCHLIYLFDTHLVMHHYSYLLDVGIRCYSYLVFVLQFGFCGLYFLEYGEPR